MKHKDVRPWLSVIAGGESLVSHAGGVLLVETARRSGLAQGLSRLLGPWRLPLATHDPGKIVADLAVAVALGGDAACDIAVLRAQPGVFGPVASDPTVSRLIGRLAADADDALAAISAARAGARERVWHHAGAPVQNGQVVIDLDATLITAHSEKQDATRTWKKGFGFHPLLGFVDHGDCSGGEPVCELLRPGKAGSNTAADHVVVLDAALAQLPAAQRARDETGQVAVLVRTDAAGATKEFAAHLAEQGVEFSVGASFAHLDVATALAHLPEQVWIPAYQARKPRAAEHGVQIRTPRRGPRLAEVPVAGSHLHPVLGGAGFAGLIGGCPRLLGQVREGGCHVEVGEAGPDGELDSLLGQVGGELLGRSGGVGAHQHRHLAGLVAGALRGGQLGVM